VTKRILILPTANERLVKAPNMGSIGNDAGSESASEQEKFSSPQKKSSLEDSEKSINMEALAPEEKANPVRSEDDAPATEPEGDALDRIPSQAQKLGKKKIIIIMTALCVSGRPGPN
jgi:hypothetical protein